MLIKYFILAIVRRKTEKINKNALIIFLLSVVFIYKLNVTLRVRNSISRLFKFYQKYNKLTSTKSNFPGKHGSNGTGCTTPVPSVVHFRPKVLRQKWRKVEGAVPEQLSETMEKEWKRKKKKKGERNEEARILTSSPRFHYWRYHFAI